MHRKSPYGALRNLSADCYNLVPLPIELQTYQSNQNIPSEEEISVNKF